MNQADALQEMIRLGDFSSEVEPFQLLLTGLLDDIIQGECP